MINEKESKILLVIPPTSEHLGLFDDLKQRNDVVIFQSGYREVNIISSLIRKVVLNKSVNKILNIPNKEYWFNTIDPNTLKTFNKVVFIDVSLNYFTLEQVKRMKFENNNIKLYLFLLNSLNAESESIQSFKDRIDLYPWDDIFSFDSKDAKDNNYTYKCFCYYSKPKVDLEHTVINDVFFIGGEKGKREKKITEIYDYLIMNGVICDFSVMSNQRKHQYSKGIRVFSNGWIPYNRVISGVNKSNCILEILQEGQTGPSLRYFEAIAFNKKLLTNNPNIVCFPYYDDRYMKVFNNIDDIDIEWIREKMNINYNYDDDFSPNHLIDYVKKI